MVDLTLILDQGQFSSWRYVTLEVVLWRLASSAASNRSQMRTSECTCLIFGVSIGLDPGYKRTNLK